MVEYSLLTNGVLPEVLRKGDRETGEERKKRKEEEGREKEM